jgi:hypothetical protein
MEWNDINSISHFFKVNFIIVYPQIIWLMNDLFSGYILYIYRFYFHIGIIS